jgi:hypothetical protein
MNGRMFAVDWGTAVTGVVGVAGIGGALLSAKMTSKSDTENLRTSISAENKRETRREAPYLRELSRQTHR